MRVRETRQRGVGNARIAAAFFSTSRVSVRRESAERAARDSRRILQHLARVCETRKRGVGNARFAAAFFSPLRASARRESAEWATRDSRRLSSTPRAHPGDAKARSGKRANRGAFIQPLARIRETRKRGVGNSRFAAAFFSPSRASARRESAERAKHESRRFSSAPRARPRDAPARSRQRSNRGAFPQSPARVRETRKRGAGNARFAAAFFCPSRASARRESAERAKRESRRFSSAPRAHPGDAKARSGKRANRGGFLQPLARIRETRKRGAGNTRFAAAFFNPSCASARRASAEWATSDSRRLSFSPSRASDGSTSTACSLSPSRASARRASAERATHDSRRLFSAPCARPRDAKARSGQLAIRGGFLQPLARIRETRQRGVGNARFAAAFFSPSRASARRASVE